MFDLGIIEHTQLVWTFCMVYLGTVTATSCQDMSNTVIGGDGLTEFKNIHNECCFTSSIHHFA